MPLLTGDLILKEHPYGFKSFIVVGNRGIGKSTYALIVSYEIYRQLGHTKEDAWRQALQSCKFSMSEVVRYLKSSAVSKEPRPVMVWDDLGVHASGTKYFLNMKQVDNLKAMLDTIRTAISGLIMTCPTTHGLLSMLNKYDDYKIVIHKGKGARQRIAKAYLWSTLPSGKRFISKAYFDNYNCWLPDWVFNQYMKHRKDALLKTLNVLEKQ